MADLISSLSSEVVAKALEGLSQRHKAIASNLANVDTPGYRRKEVAFEHQLQQAIDRSQGRDSKQASNKYDLPMQTTQAGHFAIGAVPNSVGEVSPQMTESEGQAYRNDGNAVDVEIEMTRLAKNTERYVALANVEGRLFNNIKTAIRTLGEV